MSVFLPKRLSVSPDLTAALPQSAGLHLLPFVFQPERLRNRPAAPHILDVPSRL
jgi:hypothetical protein